jgi:hydrogenase nickel incorporation protein HypA/HybF
MHELGITRNIVAIVDEAARGRKVVRITLEVGALAGVAADAIAFCFAAVTDGTALAGCALDIVARPGAELSIKTMELEDREAREEAP